MLHPRWSWPGASLSTQQLARPRPSMGEHLIAGLGPFESSCIVSFQELAERQQEGRTCFPTALWIQLRVGLQRFLGSWARAIDQDKATAGPRSGYPGLSACVLSRAQSSGMAHDQRQGIALLCPSLPWVPRLLLGLGIHCFVHLASLRLTTS